jgi:hypothetical protein
VLFACLEQATAWRMLHDPQVSGQLTSEAYFNLCKDAGYSKDAAKKMAKDRAWQRMQQDLKA